MDSGAPCHGTSNQHLAANDSGGAGLVSLAITPTAPAVLNGSSAQLTATGTYSDGSTQILTDVGLLISTTFSYLAAIAPDGVSAVLFLIPVFLFSNVVATVLSTIPLVMVHKQAVGAAFGFVNTAGQLSGILSPLLIGWVLTETKGRFEIVLCGMVALTLIAVYPASRIKQTTPLASLPALA